MKPTQLLIVELLFVAGIAWPQPERAVALSPPQIYLAGQRLALQPAPTIENGLLCAPWALIAAAMGADVEWQAKEERLRIRGVNGSTLEARPGTTFLVDGQSATLPLPLTLAAGALYGPGKPLVEALGGILEWQPATRRAAIYGRLLSLETRADEQGACVSFTTSIPVTLRLEHMGEPRRSVVDLPGIYVGATPPLNYVNRAGLLRVRCGQYETKPPVGRLVLDLRERAPAVSLKLREDSCGGRLIVGAIQGDEPLVFRPRPQLLRVVAEAPTADRLSVTAYLSDPLPAVYDVLRQPYRVLLDLHNAEIPESILPAAQGLPFVKQFRLLEPSRLVLYLEELVPFRVRAAENPDRLEIQFARDRLADKKIMIDPGHGGKDSGARGRTLLEKDVNLDMAKRTVACLAGLGARPYLTRDDDYFVDLYARPRLTNALQADLFVSIHCNATGGGWRGSGTGTYFCHPQSKALAIVMQETLVPALGSRDYGVHRQRFCVIRETQIPAILIETLFIDNPEEEKLLAQPAFRQKVAEGICEGLRRYTEGTQSFPPALLPLPPG